MQAKPEQGLVFFRIDNELLQLIEDVPVQEPVISPVDMERITGREPGFDQQRQDLLQRTQSPQRTQPQRRGQRPGDQQRHDIWMAESQQLTAINLVFGEWLATLHPILRTFVLATVAVPIVIYGIMPQLHRLRTRLTNRTTA